MLKKRGKIFFVGFVILNLFVTVILYFFISRKTSNSEQQKKINFLIVPQKQEILKRKTDFKRHNTKNPLISVVIPTYNSMKYLPKAISSVLKQTYKNFELIIVNDCSTDNTKEFLKKYSNHPKIKIINNKKNKKLPRSLNTGFKIAKGEYFTWVSSDNFCTKNFLSEMLKVLKEYKDSKFVYSDYYLVNEKNKIMKDYHSGAAVHDGIFDGGGARYSFRKSLIENGGVAAFLYHKSVLPIIGKYDGELVGTEDWDYWIRISEVNPMMGYSPKPLMYYRIHKESMTYRMKNTVKERETKMIEKRLMNHGKIFSLNILFPALRFCVEKQNSFVVSLMQFAQELVLGRYTKKIGLKYQKLALKSNKNQRMKLISNINIAMMFAVNGDLKKAKEIVKQIKNSGDDYQKWNHKLDFIEYYELVLKSKRKSKIKFCELDANEELFKKDKPLQLAYDQKKSVQHHPRKMGMFLPRNILGLVAAKKIDLELMFDYYQFFDEILLFASSEMNQIQSENILNFDDSYQLEDLFNQEKPNLIFIYGGNSSYCEQISNQKKQFQVLTFIESDSVTKECAKRSNFFITKFDKYAKNLMKNHKVSPDSIFTLPNPDTFSLVSDTHKQEFNSYSVAFILFPKKQYVIKEFIRIVKEYQMRPIFVQIPQIFSDLQLSNLQKQISEIENFDFIKLTESSSVKSVFKNIPLIYLDHLNDSNDLNILLSQIMAMKRSIIVGKDSAPLRFKIEDEITGILIEDS
eukprot:gene7012-11177_t